MPTISIAYLPPELDPHPLLFERPLPLTPRVLAKIAPVVERPGIHLGVWHGADALEVWGTTRTVPPNSFVLEVVEPGLLVVKHARGERAGKYVNVAVLEGDQCKVIDENAKSLPDCPTLLTSLLGFDSPSSWSGPINVLVQLAVSMRGHGRGGSLLIVPAAHDGWRESIVSPVSYAVAPPFQELAHLMRESEDANQPHLHQIALRETVDAIAGLTAVDGATVMTDNYALLAFGVKITTPQIAAGRDGHGDRTDRRRNAFGGVAAAARRDAAFVRRAVRAGSTRRRGAGGVAGSPLHGVRVVAVRRWGACTPRRNAVALAPQRTSGGRLPQSPPALAVVWRAVSAVSRRIVPSRLLSMKIWPFGTVAEAQVGARRRRLSLLDVLFLDHLQQRLRRARCR